jgi:hypothetical protein
MVTIKGRSAASEPSKKRIRWNRSPSLGVVTYRLYWATVGEVGYESDFMEIGDRSEIILPDEVPPLIPVHGEIALGITAVNHDGNESDMVRFTVNFDPRHRRAPASLLRSGEEGWEPPARAPVLVDDLHFWLIRKPTLQGQEQSPETRDYFVDSHHVEETKR